MSTLLAGFEGGTNGAAMTTAAGDATTPLSSGSMTGWIFDNAHVAHGTMAAKLPSTSSGTQRLTWSASGAAKALARGYVWLSGLPGADYNVVWMTSSAGSTSARAYINSLGKLRVGALGVTNLATAPADFPTGQWVRVEVYADAGTSSTTGKVRAAYYLGDSTTAVWDSGEFTTNVADATGALGEIRFGVFNAAVNLWVDDIGAKTAADAVWGAWPWAAANDAPTVTAKASPPKTVPGYTVTLTGTAADSDGTITSTSWAQVGTTPAVATLSGSGLTRTVVMPSTLGTYTFRFSATDSGGTTTTADVTVTVAAKPATSSVTHANTAEGGTDEAVVLASGTGSGSGDAYQGVVKSAGAQVYFDTARKAHGSLAYRIEAPSGESASLVWSVSNGRKVARRAYLIMDEPPTAATQIMVFRSPTGAVSRLSLTADGRLLIQGGTDVTLTQPLPADELLRLELFTDVDTGRVGGGWAYNDGPFEEVVTPRAVTIPTEGLDSIQVGKLNATTWNAVLWIDDDAANVRAAADTFVGPYLATYSSPPVLPGNADVEPKDLVSWTALGVGTWSLSGSTGPTPTFTTSADGKTLTYRPPMSFAEYAITWAYGGSTRVDTVLPATDHIKVGGVDTPVRLRTRWP